MGHLDPRPIRFNDRWNATSARKIDRGDSVELMVGDEQRSFRVDEFVTDARFSSFGNWERRLFLVQKAAEERYGRSLPVANNLSHFLEAYRRR